MSAKKNKYESVLVFSIKNGEEAANATLEKFKSLVEQNATLEALDIWGKKKLAYDINYESEGFYALMSFESAPEFIAEFDRIIGITDGVLRSLIVAK